MMKRLIFLLLLIPFLANAQKRVDQLPEISTPSDSDELIVIRAGDLWNLSLENLKTYTNPSSSVSTTSFVRQYATPTDSTHIWAFPNDTLRLDKLHVYTDSGYVHLGWHCRITGVSSTLKPIFFLSTGQSNAREHPNRTGGDTSSHSNVLHWDTEDDPSGLWTQADVGGNNAIPFQLAKQLADNDNRIVYYISVASTGRAISSWQGTGEMIENVKNAVSSSGVSSIDFILWDQGEANTSTDSTVYLTAFGEVLDTFISQTWYDENKPFLAVGMYTGANACGPGQQELYRDFATDLNNWTHFVDTDGISAEGDNCHFSGVGVDTIGRRAYVALKSLPYDLTQNARYLNGSTASADGVVTSGEYDDGTQEITLQRSVGGPVIIDVGDLSGGGGSPPASPVDEIVYGTGTGQTSDSDYKITSNGLLLFNDSPLGKGAGALSLRLFSETDCTGPGYTAIGTGTGESIVGGSFSWTMISLNAGLNLTTANSTVIIGRDAARYQSNFSNLTSTENSLFLGALTKGTQGATNENVFGYAAEGRGSNTVQIGNSSVTDVYFNGRLHAETYSFDSTFTPSGTGDSSGSTGDFAYDNDYFYVKTSTGWKRASLSTF
ncbi:MAG: sialate O-acetylesterase [Bacteroidota bacterium]